MKSKLLIISTIILIYSCSGDNGIIEELPIDPILENPKEYIVSFGFTGEITNIEESPLSRAITNDLYGIQVYSMPATETNQSEYKPCAYGLFDDKANMTIKLLDGYKYKFVSTMIINGKSKISSNSSNWYYAPFFAESATPIGLSFIYSSEKTLSSLSLGVASLSGNVNAYRPNTDRYYGESLAYIPSEGGVVSINMKRVSFGVKIIAEGLSNGKIKAIIEKSVPMYISHPSTEIEDIFTFENPGYYYSDAMRWTRDDYSETASVSISWEKSDGVVVPLATQNITFKRNKKTTITVKVKDNSMNNGVDISNENTPIGDGGNITIDTNNGTDTGVNPNP